MRENLIEVRNLRFAYRDKPVLKGISFDVATGDTLSILGANGSGKSTLLRIMLGFLKFEGEVLIAGKSVRDYGKKGSPHSSPTCRKRTNRPMTTASLTSR